MLPPNCSMRYVAAPGAALGGARWALGPTPQFEAAVREARGLVEALDLGSLRAAILQAPPPPGSA